MPIRQIDPNNIPSTVHAVGYAVTLQIGGNIIGSIESFTPNVTRTFQRLYELNGPDNPRFGEASELIPSSVTGNQISVSRVRIYTQPLSVLLNTDPASAFDGIANSYVPFDIEERWVMPDNSGIFGTLYKYCWLASLTYGITSGAARVVETGVIEVTYRRRIGEQPWPGVPSSVSPSSGVLTNEASPFTHKGNIPSGITTGAQRLTEV